MKWSVEQGVGGGDSGGAVGGSPISEPVSPWCVHWSGYVCSDLLRVWLGAVAQPLEPSNRVIK